MPAPAGCAKARLYDDKTDRFTGFRPSLPLIRLNGRLGANVEVLLGLIRRRSPMSGFRRHDALAQGGLASGSCYGL